MITSTPEEKSLDQIPREILDSLTRFDMPVVRGIDPADECFDGLH